MRTLPLVPFMRERLLTLKEEQQENRRLCGRSYIKDYIDYVCVNEIGDITVNRHLPEICSHVLCSELRHLCLDDSFLIVGDEEEYLIWSRSVCHRRSVLS